MVTPFLFDAISLSISLSILLDESEPPVFWWSTMSQNRHLRSPHDPENVFKDCPRPLLTPSRLLYTPHRLTSLVTLHLFPPHTLLYQQSSRGIKHPFFSTTVVILPSLIRHTAILSSYLDVSTYHILASPKLCTSYATSST